MSEILFELQSINFQLKNMATHFENIDSYDSKYGFK